MPPVEIMTVPQLVQWRVTHAGACIEEAIADIHYPSNERQQDWSPGRQTNVRGPCESPSPDDSDGWGIEAGEMPEVQRSQKLPAPRYFGRGAGNGLPGRIG